MMINDKNYDTIYCDWAATAQFDKEILDKAYKTQLEFNGNPSSIHKAGTDAKKILNDARSRCARALGVNEASIIFTSGGTESNHLAITNLLLKSTKGSIVISNIEHPAVTKMAENMEKCGWKVKYAKCDTNGIVSPQAVEKELQDDTALVCIMAVNNETGSIQPIYEISDMILNHYNGRRKPKFHVDCVQAAGKIPLNLSYRGIDSAAISAHKIGGPRGIGILYLKDSHQESFLKGGGQENGLRSGTENLFGIEAISLCLEKYFILNDKSPSFSRFILQKELTLKFLKNLKSIERCIFIPQERKFDDDRFSPWIIQTAFKDIPGEVLVRALSAKGIFISTGSACSSRKMSRPILEAMKIKDDVAQWGVRFSFGSSTTEIQMEKVFEETKEIVDRF